MASKPTDRHAGIDSFRYLLCFAVALLHSLPGDAGRTDALWASLAACACRAAVPFFFIASGYFLRVPSVWTPQVLMRPLVRLLPVYVAWFLIYAAVTALQDHQPVDLSLHELLTGGSGFHLWFIPVLGVALAVVPTAIRLAGLRATIGGAVALAVVGLAFGAYRDVLGLQPVGGTRLTMAPALVLTGYLIARGGLRLGAGPAACCVLLLLIASGGEEWLIASLSGTGFTSHDFLVSTVPLGAAIFLLANAIGRGRAIDALASLGRISLGVYAAHLLFVGLLAPWTGRDSVYQACGLAVGATLLATLLGVTLDRVPLVRRLVR